MAVDYSVANYEGGSNGDYLNSDDLSAGEYLFTSRATLLSPITNLYFDIYEELLWTGQESGHHTSFYSKDLLKHSSVRVRTDPVLQSLSLDESIISLCKNSLNLYSRYGLVQERYSPDTFVDMHCMMQSGPTSIMVGGSGPKVLDIDLSRMTVLDEVVVEEAGVSVMRRNNRFIVFGDSNGRIVLRDPQTMRIEHTYAAHTGPISDFDVHGNLIVSCGFAHRMGRVMVDRFLMLFDMRMMRTISPMVCSLDPCFVRFIPTYSDRLAVLSSDGQFQLVDIATMNPSTLMRYSIQPENTVTSFDISPSKNVMAFGDASGCVQLWSNQAEPQFNQYSRPTEFADELPSHRQIIFGNVLFPMSSVPMHYPGHGSLLSEWPENFGRVKYRKPESIPAKVLNDIQWKGTIGYAANTDKRRPNQCPYKLSKEPTSRRRLDSVPESPIGRGDDPFVLVPKKYRKVEIKYSKLGVEDFDFRHYNKTNFAGLEIHIPNAYCNCMLQNLYFIEPLRTVLLNHLCQKEFCLACELGFLFHMLDISKGKTCQASNFLRAFRTIPQAGALGLVLGDDQETSKRTELPRIIHSWIRFVLQQIHLDIIGADSGPQGKSNSKSKKSGKESKKSAGAAKQQDMSSSSLNSSSSKDTVASRLFRTVTSNKFICACGAQTSRDQDSYVFNMVYPIPAVDVPDFEFGEIAFADVLRDSINAKPNTQCWCSTCEKYHSYVQKKSLLNLPDIMSINCQVDTDNNISFWARQLELLKKKIGSMQVPAAAASASSSAQKKPCRYGDQCTRGNCMFYHKNKPSDNSNASSHASKPAIEVSWVPQIFAAKMDSNGSIVTKSLQDPSDSVFGGSAIGPMELKALESEGFVIYELLSTIANIREKDMTHLVSSVHVTETYHRRKEGITTSQTYLFNDFSIVDIEKDEMSQFNLEWKWPCALFYQKKNLNDSYDLTVSNPITADCFLSDDCVGQSMRGSTPNFTPLRPDQLPKKGDIIGLDAEFVSLNQEEAELRSDGTQSTIKPSQMSVARITCLRGFNSDLPLEAFLDDYISTQEAVVDYLTRFSGIKPGDLDASVSTKRLTTLKKTYQKLRYLADSGVIFVGHGLKKDFRVINLVVPQDQIVDTVNVFYLLRQRMISLKFLAWYFFGEIIQDGMHDSVEDARTALKLHKKYEELKSEGADVLHKAVNELYAKGRDVQWKIPEEKEGQ